MSRHKSKGGARGQLTDSQYETLMIGWPIIASSQAGYNCDRDDFGSREEMEAAWRIHGARLIEELQTYQPGRFPWAKYEFEGPPEKRTFGLYGVTKSPADIAKEALNAV